MNVVEKITARGALTVELAGKYLGKSRVFVEGEIKSGKLGFVMLGNTLMIPKFELERYLRQSLLYKKPTAATVGRKSS